MCYKMSRDSKKEDCEECVNQETGYCCPRVGKKAKQNQHVTSNQTTNQPTNFFIANY